MVLPPFGDACQEQPFRTPLCALPPPQWIDDQLREARVFCTKINYQTTDRDCDVSSSSQSVGAGVVSPRKSD